MSNGSNTMFFENRDVCRLLSTKEAATYLSVTPNALRILVCRGRVRAYKLGRHLRFKLRDLKALLKKGET